MRKNIFALSLILPLLFLFSVFSAAKTVTLGVQISASGIELTDVPQNGYRIDLSEKEREIVLRAKVLPEAASDRGYFFRVEGNAVTVDKAGKLHAVQTGEATVYAVSRDGGFTDGVNVAVYASAPYDIAFTLGGEEPEKTDGGYRATLSTGRYSFEARAVPGGTAEISSSEFAFVDRAAGTLFLPFGGTHTLTLSLNGRWKGEEIAVEKRVEFKVGRFTSESGFVINGGDPILALARGSTRATFYIEGEPPAIAPCDEIVQSSVERLGEDRYRAEIVFDSGEDFSFFVTDESGRRRERVTVTFAEFDLTVRPDLPVQTETPGILVGVPVSFYAVPALPAEGISYEWEAEGVSLSPAGEVCTVTAKEPGEFVLRVTASRGGETLTTKELSVRAVRRVRTVQFAEKTEAGLSRSRVVGGRRYENGVPVRNDVALRLVLTDGERELSGAEDILFSSSDGSVAEIAERDGAVVLLPKGRGKVTVTAEWAGNPSYGEDVRATLSLYVTDEGVEVGSSEELFRAAGEGREIVLVGDILLGTDGKGAPLPPEVRAGMLSKMPSTFNTEYYRSASSERPENAKVAYVIEFRNNVYGNGHTLNAELFTADRDGAVPRFFRGPLCFVRFGQLASVAAQDNISFLVRTDGVTLFDVSLLGCGDGLLHAEGGYDLSRLNTVGTVLELNADCALLNCRVRNGRTVVRAYGGNREGDRYFSPRSAEEERICVRIEGCHLAQGREFLLKIGANAAVRSSSDDPEPDLPGYPYGGSYEGDEAFYRDCVFTDVTLKDSVLEKSGLFCVGAESNFSGVLLAEGGGGGFDGWAGTGGTSYASVLRFRGDVRLYDWKELSLIDSSTLIETELPELKLDLAAMLSFVAARDPATFGDLLDEEGNKRYVHGGVAFYGGGKNYSLFEGAADSALSEYRVALSALGQAEGNTGYQGQILPSAAGTREFRFFLYGKGGSHNRAAQLAEAEAGRKYEKISPLSPF